MINILDIQPHQVSINLAGYIVTFYGDIKTGKTTISCQFNKPLLLAFEKGYNAIPGIKAQDLNKWTEFKELLLQLESDEAKAMYKYVIIDTADLAFLFAEQFIFNREGVQGYGDIGYGAGYGMVEKEFDKCMRKIVQLGYGLIFISHAQDKTMEDQNGEEYNRIIPTLEKRGRKVINRMSDIVGYARVAKDLDTGEEKTFLFMRGTTRFEAGSRFKYTSDYIEFSYENLVEDIENAIKKLGDNGATLIEEKENHYILDQDEYDLEEELEIFYQVANEKLDAGIDQEDIAAIIECHIGMERNIKNCKQADVIHLVTEDVKKL